MKMLILQGVLSGAGNETVNQCTLSKHILKIHFITNTTLKVGAGSKVFKVL